MSKGMNHWILRVLIILLSLSVTLTIRASGQNVEAKLVVFGDSLVDVGNIPPITFLTPAGTPGLVIPPPTRYDRGRFSNGRNVADYVAESMGVHLLTSNTGYQSGDNVSFAHGGATTDQVNPTPGGFPVPGLLGQVGQYLAALAPDESLDDRTLYMIWAGSNDYLLGILQPNSGISPDPLQVTENIRQAITQLRARGAKRFVVLNLPDLGKTPVCLGFFICEPLTQLTQQHNSLLHQVLSGLEQTFDTGSIIEVDVYSIFERIAANPAGFGFIPPVQAPGPAAGCLFQPPDIFDPANCALLNTFQTEQVFWDEEHPTTAVHQIIAQQILRLLRRRAQSNRLKI